MKLTQLSPDDITPLLNERLRNTFERYVGVGYWRLSNVRRFASKWPAFVLEHEDDTFLLYVYSEQLFPGRSNANFGLDYAEHLVFYKRDLWTEVPVMRSLFERLGMQYVHTVQVPYVVNEHKPLRQVVKDAHHNYRPHFFGPKSQQFSIEHLDTFHGPDTDLLNYFVYVVQKYGWSRYEYLKERGEHADPEMYEWVFDFHNLMNAGKPLTTGITLVRDNYQEVVGLLSWWSDGEDGFLDEIVIDKRPDLRPLSLYGVTTIHSVQNLHQMGCRRVFLGWNINELGDYKERLFALSHHEYRFTRPIFHTREEAVEILLSVQ